MRKGKGLLLMIMIISLSFVVSGCFFLDFIFGPDQEEKEPEPEDIEEQQEREIDRADTDYDEENKRETVFYLLDNADNLVPVITPIEWTEGIAKKTLDRMSACQENQAFWQDTGLNPTLPENTEVLGMAINDGTARVNFNEQFLDMEPDVEENALNSITYTLTEYETIDEVEILVEGEYVSSLPSGTEISANLSRQGINREITTEATQTAGETELQLYFVNEEKYMVPVTRHVAETDELEGNAIYELMKGAEADGSLASYVSSELDINEVNMENNTLQMNLTNLTNDEDMEDMALKQLVFTLTELDHINDVEVAINGSVIDTEQLGSIEEVNFRY